MSDAKRFEHFPTPPMPPSIEGVQPGPHLPLNDLDLQRHYGRDAAFGHYASFSNYEKQAVHQNKMHAQEIGHAVLMGHISYDTSSALIANLHKYSKY